MVVVLLKSCGEQRKARLQDATPDKTLCIPSNIQTASEMFFDIAEAYSDDPKNAVNQVSLIKIPKCMEMARYYFMTSLSATTETTMVIQQNNYLEELRRLMKCAPNCD